MPICPNCGTILSEEDLRCPNCKAPANAEAAEKFKYEAEVVVYFEFPFKMDLPIFIDGKEVGVAKTTAPLHLMLKRGNHTISLPVIKTIITTQNMPFTISDTVDLIEILVKTKKSRKPTIEVASIEEK